MIKTCILSLICAAITASAQAAAPDVAALLASADATRAPGLTNFEETISITPYSAGQSQGATQYDLVARYGTGTLVTGLSADQTGQKVLSTAKGFWIFFPRTHRAIRLTPMELLRGQASIGDISRLHFATDYTPAGPLTSDGKSQTITLRANSDVASYARVDLVFSLAGQLQSGKFYVQSGKLLKTVTFGQPENVAGHTMIATETFFDAIDPTQSTVVHVDTVAAHDAVAGLFTPEALASQ